ncbi:hypothetical protein CK203_041415 [Vitis vinifera]|uniref:Uncharacterized protein n=1 Tax=Vitis vinifera TaxID=29760 RepID=A0A438H5Z0_VITVI|nr:hypothetical protein CK203_041415 [Vitis vinifera]
MSAKKKAVSSVRASDAREKSIDKLNAKEFRDRFCIPNGVTVELLNEEEGVVSTEKAEGNAIIFSKEQFNAGSVPSSGVVQGIPPFLPDSTRLHPSQHSPGADGMQHYKHAVQSRPLAAGAAGFDEGRGEGTRDGPGSGRGYWSIRRGLFLQTTPQCFREVKEADAEKRRALLDDREKRKNEGTLRKAPDRNAAQPPLQGKPSEKEEAGQKWEGSEGAHSPKEFVPPPITHAAEVIIEEPVNPAPHSISSGPGHVAGLNHSGPSLSAVARLATLAEEAASINHPGSPIRC